MSIPDEKQAAGIMIRGLTKSYGEQVVIKGLDLFIPYGKASCLMAGSGWGKTTLLNILMGFERQDDGIITGLPQKISAVFQEDRLCESFSTFSNAVMALSPEAKKTGSPLYQKVLDCLNTLGIAEAKDKKVSTLSGGMKRRVSLARAYLYGGDLLILDEPFTGLDMETKRVAAELLKTFPGTILMVSHDTEEAALMGAEILRL